MVPTSVMLNTGQTLIGSDTGSLNPGALGCKVHLIQSNFTPGPATDFTTLTEADFTGATAIQQPVSGTHIYFDPVLQKRVIQINAPSGLWHWQASATTNLPQTIYGWCLTDNASAVTYGSDVFDTPILLQSTGDGVDIAEVRFALPNDYLQ